MSPEMRIFCILAELGMQHGGFSVVHDYSFSMYSPWIINVGEFKYYAQDLSLEQLLYAHGHILARILERENASRDMRLPDGVAGTQNTETTGQITITTNMPNPHNYIIRNFDGL